ncbi:cobaltochelatase subunit CobN [Achromobacter spanius]|uniref:Cobalt chelatase n=1 Tax=Achromobacter spanius TaxID=217203 RepID=A0A2S0I8Q4_9BURK|nr:cobaltochelatase subunit CobN [Achromobacter spanius]AVJ28177.1 cobalt chelatase [Achromobacter spanius]
MTSKLNNYPALQRCLAVARLALMVWLLSMLGMTPVQAALAVPAPPRIAVVSIEVAQQPTTLRAAVQRLAGKFQIDLFGLGAGQLPGIDGVDLGAYDLVLVEGVGPRLAQYRSQFDAAGARTRVLVINGSEWLRGNVPADRVPDAIVYWRNATVSNYVRLFNYLGVRLLGMRGDVEPPVRYADHAYYHPAHVQAFESREDYLTWMQQRLPDASGRPRVGILFYRSLALGENTGVIDALITQVERQGGLPVPIWRSDSRDSLQPFMGPDGRAAIDVLILCASQIDYRDHRAGVEQARALGVTILGCTTDYTRTPDEWRRDIGGFAPDRSGQLALSEVSGIVEPMMVGARTVQPDGAVRHVPIPEQIEWRVARALAWARLHRMGNYDKRIVVAFHSEAADQADVGSDPDTYLDAQASLAALLKRLRAEGYDVGDAELPDAAELARMMARDASNIDGGLWDPSQPAREPAQTQAAQTEMARRVRDGNAVLLPEADYLRAYARLPQALHTQTEAQWGPPPGRLMVHTDAFGTRAIVLPILRFGKVALMPHPVWGYQQDARALRSTGALAPHHQYIAFYLWMQQAWHADAYLPIFTQLSLMPGKQQGPSRDDWVGALIGNVPHIQPTPLQANGGVGNKRRTQAVTIGFMPPIGRLPAAPQVQALREALGQAIEAASPATQDAVRAAAQPFATALDLDPRTADWPALAAALQAYLQELDSAVTPIGGHILGQAPAPDTVASMVQAMLAGDSADAPAIGAVRAVLDGNPSALPAESTTRIRMYAERILAAPREMDAVIGALAGRYVTPGPMADAIRNPDALPSGRNPYTTETRRLPTKQAWEQGAKLADELVANYQREHGGAPGKVAFVLWSGESAQNEGMIEAQIMRLLGTRPVWNPRGEVIDVALEDRAALGRARVDVLVTTSGTYRDHFRDKIAMLAKAARLAASAPEADNPVRQSEQNTRRILIAAGVAPDVAATRAARRIYSTAPGAYSPSTQFAIQAGAEWTDERLARLYMDRLGHAYGETDSGAADAEAFAAQLSGVDAAVFSRSSNAYGLLDTSMPAAYLGGIGMAVRQQTGRQISNYVADTRNMRRGEVRMETLSRTFNRELATRYLNPAWIQAMQGSGYNGARYMAELPANLLLWDTTTPDLVSDADWAQVKEVYVDDKHDLGLKAYLEASNPAAREKLIETLLAAIDRGAWKADAQQRSELAAALADSKQAAPNACAATDCGASPGAQQAPARAPGGQTANETGDQAGDQAGEGAVVEGYALQTRQTADAPDPAASRHWPLALIALAAILAGMLRRPRW